MFQFLFILPFLFFSVVLHEIAHGLMAERLGDSTARDAGRISLNPLVHIDLIGTIILPVLLIISNSGFVFGWAKPVPVNPYNLRKPRQDMMWVSLAGPLANLSLALALSVLIKFLPLSSLNQGILEEAAFINIILAVFNLIPIPPLDGSKIIMGLLPRQLAYHYFKLEPYGFLIIFLLFISGGIRIIIWPVVEILANLLGLHLL